MLQKSIFSLHLLRELIHIATTSPLEIRLLPFYQGIMNMLMQEGISLSLSTCRTSKMHPGFSASC